MVLTLVGGPAPVEVPVEIGALEAGQLVDGVLYLAQASIGETSAGKPYLRATFRDIAHSTIDAKLWDFSGEPPRVGVYRVVGRVEAYNGALTLRLTRPPAALPEMDSAPYLVDPRPARAVRARLELAFRDALDGIESPALRELLSCVFDDETLGLFFDAPAALQHHGCFPGGLAFHTLAVWRSAMEAAQRYGDGGCNLDVLGAGALLHDVGKIDEMEFAEDRGGAAYRREAPRGRLYGHMPAGLLRAHKQAVLLGIDEAPEVVNLFHLIISHHGEREWGAPAPPMTQEARFLHAADEFASKVEVTVDVLEEIHTRADGDWREGGRNRPRLYLGFDARRGPRSGQR
jgi:3'-5' exoribonuclease